MGPPLIYKFRTTPQKILGGVLLIERVRRELCASMVGDMINRAFPDTYGWLVWISPLTRPNQRRGQRNKELGTKGKKKLSLVCQINKRGE